jgi:hypothetical protein
VLVSSLNYTIRIDNPSLNTVIGGNLFAPLIGNETARYHVIMRNISSSSGQAQILNDNAGNAVANWKDITIGGKQSFVVEIEYYVLSFAIRYSINQSHIEEYNKTSDIYKTYTQPERLIQSNDTRIIEKAQNVTADVESPYGKAYRIYSFVANYLSYKVQDEERGALWALENRTGDCSEYSYLFAALCRAVGIPARIKAGFGFRSTEETIENGHMWAEYYVENYGWIPVDPAWRYFSMTDGKHFSSIQSIPEVMPYANYVFNSTFGPQPDGSQTATLAHVSTSVFGTDPLIENTVKAIQYVKNARFPLFLEELLGAPIVFPSQSEEAEQLFSESQIHLQTTLDSWEKAPQIARSDINLGLENARNALTDAWILTAQMLTLLITIPIVIIVVVWFFIRRSERRNKQH